MSNIHKNQLSPGDLILYPYIWGWQADQGHQTAEKFRPAFIMHISENDQAVICGITTRFVKTPRLFIPIPEIECAQAGLHDREFSKLVISECNIDNMNNEATRPRKMGGRFSPEFLTPLRRRFMTVLANKKCLAVHRDVKISEPEMEEQEMSM